MRRELQLESAATRRMGAAKVRSTSRRPSPAGSAMPPKQTKRRVLEEIPLAHYAATWDEDTFESGWDDEEARLAGELAQFADD
jgi:hypothetical protein